MLKAYCHTLPSDAHTCPWFAFEHRISQSCASVQALRQAIENIMPAIGSRLQPVPVATVLAALQAASAPYLGERSAAFAHFAASFSQCAISLEAWDSALAAAQAVEPPAEAMPCTTAQPAPGDPRCASRQTHASESGSEPRRSLLPNGDAEQTRKRHCNHITREQGQHLTDSCNGRAQVQDEPHNAVQGECSAAVRTDHDRLASQQAHVHRSELHTKNAEDGRKEHCLSLSTSQEAESDCETA